MFSAKQFSFSPFGNDSAPHSVLEHQLASLQDLSQLLSEDIDRYTEHCSQIWQQVAESIWQQQLDLFSGKPSAEQIMNLNARLHALYEQGQQTQTCLQSIVSDAINRASALAQQSFQMPQQFSFTMPFAEFSFAQVSQDVKASEMKDISGIASATIEEPKTARKARKAVPSSTKSTTSRTKAKLH